MKGSLRRFASPAVAVALILILALAAACDDDDNGNGNGNGDTAPTATAEAPDGDAATTIDVSLEEFSVSLSAATAAAGTVTFNVSSDGTMAHNFRVIKTDLDPDALAIDEDTFMVNEADVDVVASSANLDVGDTRGLFTTGRCALSIDWGDIGTLAIDPATSTVQDLVGAVILPGSRRVLDRATGKLVDCDATICPHAVNGVNHAPFAAFGGCSGAINASSDQRVKDAAYDFLSYMSQPAQANEDVTIGITGFNPYRTSQFESLDLWIKAGMSEAAAKNYLGAIAASLNSPNMVLDLRVPQNQR